MSTLNPTVPTAGEALPGATANALGLAPTVEPKVLKRVFKYGVKVFDDPDPNMSPQKVLEHYRRVHDYLDEAEVSPHGRKEGDTWVYEFTTPPVRTKG